MKLFRKSRFSRINILGIILIMLGIALLLFLFIDRNINPAIISFSQAKIQAIAITALTDAVHETLGANIKYTDFVNVLTDKNGKVSMLQANTMKMNELASTASDIAQEIIQSKGDEGIFVPLGTITGSKLLEGTGPKIHIKIVSFPAVSTDFDSEFENSGINQTRHKIYLTLRARIRIAIPLKTADIDVDSRVPVIETILIGDVPQTYINVDETDRMLRLVPIE